MRRLATLSAFAVVLLSSPAVAFDLAPNACAITQTNGNAEVVTQVAADTYGIERSEEPETTITFIFHNTTSADEGNPTPGLFEITIAPDGQRNIQYPWRDGWSVVGTSLRL
jgi:hypothetical protein